MIDLGHWLNETYRVAGPAAQDDDSGEDSSSSTRDPSAARSANEEKE
jgi:endogenous inhibitor of DNA gyrase (YacG/DUF329 family)